MNGQFKSRGKHPQPPPADPISLIRYKQFLDSFRKTKAPAKQDYSPGVILGSLRVTLAKWRLKARKWFR